MPDNPPAKSLHDLLNDVWITARIGDEWEECYDAVARFHQEAIERDRIACACLAEEEIARCARKVAIMIRARSTTPLPEGEKP